MREENDMEPEFWKSRWAANQIGFHEPATNPVLLAHFDTLALPSGSRLFVPLCGKTLDIHWLLAQGHRVAGAELSEIAVGQLFKELGVEPRIAPVGAMTHYSAPGIDIFVGNIFDLTAATLGRIDAVYDRAALVALPPTVRPKYTAHLRELTASAPQLLVCYEYDQSKRDGPPFSIPPDEVQRHYADHYHITQLSVADVPGGLKGQCPAQERVWLLAR